MGEPGCMLHALEHAVPKPGAMRGWLLTSCTMTLKEPSVVSQLRCEMRMLSAEKCVQHRTYVRWTFQYKNARVNVPPRMCTECLWKVPRAGVTSWEGPGPGGEGHEGVSSPWFPRLLVPAACRLCC